MTKLLALTALLAGVAPAAAQDPAPIVLTLDEAISRALESSQRLADAQARQEGTQAAVDARVAATKPTFVMSGGYTRTNHVDEFGVPQPNGMLRVIYPDIPDNFLTRASMRWPIYTGGRTGALVRAAEAESRAAAADIETARADLRLEVVRVYWALVTAGESVRVVEEALARADAHLRDVRSRFDNGLIPPNEVTAVEAQRARQELHLIETRNLRRRVLEDLRRLTGIDAEILPAEKLAEIAIGPGPTALPAARDLPEATAGRAAKSGQSDATVGPGPVARGPVARAEWQALQERIVAAAERVTSVQAARKPTIEVTGAADYANPNPRIFPRMDAWRTSWEAGVHATWTLWDGGRVAADAAQAAAQVTALRARLADLDALIATDIRQRQLDLTSARAALVSADAGVRAASETRRVVAERFTVGVATSTDVLDAEVALLQAELDRTRTLANIRLAEARLHRAMGR